MSKYGNARLDWIEMGQLIVIFIIYLVAGGV